MPMPPELRPHRKETPMETTEHPPHQNRQSSLQLKQRNALALRENKEAQSQLDALLVGCFAVQKMYGRAAENMEAINQVFHNLLGKYPSGAVLKAFEIWIERNQEFPTPADIVSLIKRGGRAPITREVYIAVSKKDAEHRTDADWALMREYEKEQKEVEFGSVHVDETKAEILQQETIRLREEVKFLRKENERLGRLALEKRAERANPLQPFARVVSTPEQKALNTIKQMRELGAPESDIAEFAAAYGGIGFLEGAAA